jgi:hypothetical protein
MISVQVFVAEHSKLSYDRISLDYFNLRLSSKLDLVRSCKVAVRETVLSNDVEGD